MTNEPDNRSGRRPETTSTKQGGTPAAAAGSPKTPAKLTPMRDPAPHEYGDRTDDDSKHMSPGDDDAMSKDPREKKHDDSGEGHKGPRGEAKPAQADKREHAERADASQRNDAKPKQQHGDAKSNPQTSPATKSNDSKSTDRPHGAGSAK